MLDPIVAENEMVKKGKLIATYYDSDIDDETKQKLSRINSRIAEINASPDNKELTEAQLDNKVNDIMTDIVASATQREINTVISYTADVEDLLSRKQRSEDGAIDTESLLADLRSEKRKLEAAYDGTKTEIISPSHGLFSTHVDGYEDILTKDKALSLTVNDFENLKKSNVSSDNALEKGTVCKIMDNSSWWISVLADKNQVTNFSVGETITIRIGTWETNGKIEYISNEMEGKYVITASSVGFSEYVSQNRFASVTFVKASYTGMIVPIKAVRVVDGVQGVYVRTEDTVKYRRVDIIYKDGKNAVVNPDDTASDSLKIYDEIVVDI